MVDPEDINQGTGKAAAAPPPQLPELILPCDAYTIGQSGQDAFTYFQEKQLFFRQGKTMKRINLKATNGAWLETISAETFRGVLGRYFRCRTIIQNERGNMVRDKLCSADKARGMLADETIELLDPIQAVLMCPIFVEDAQGNLKVLGKGYHPENGGIYVITDMVIDEKVPIEEARKELLDLIGEFIFVTESDRSRGFAMLLAPSFRFGKLIPADFPLHTLEADLEQTGKTHFVRLERTLYHENPFPVTGNDKFDDKLSKGIESGSGMIVLDNVRDPLKSELFESAVRGEGTVSTRSAYSKVAKSPTGHIFWMATSNKAQMTADLAARSLIIRLKKHPADHVWKTYPEGDHLLHTAENRARYFSCLFAFAREWYKAGKPQTSPVDHDFKEYCGALNWMVKNLALLADLLIGHRSEQKRMSHPELNWIRTVAIEVARIGRLLQLLKTHEIMHICDDAGIPIFELEHLNKMENREAHLPAYLGKLMKKVFKHAPDGQTLTVGGYKIERQEVREHNDARKEWFTYPVYVFSSLDDDQKPAEEGIPKKGKTLGDYLKTKEVTSEVE